MTTWKDIELAERAAKERQPDTATEPASIADLAERLLRLEALFVDPAELAKLSYEKVQELARMPGGLAGADLQLGRLTKIEDRLSLLEQAVARPAVPALGRPVVVARVARAGGRIGFAAGSPGGLVVVQVQAVDVLGADSEPAIIKTGWGCRCGQLYEVTGEVVTGEVVTGEPVPAPETGEPL